MVEVGPDGLRLHYPAHIVCVFVKSLKRIYVDQRTDDMPLKREGETFFFNINWTACVSFLIYCCVLQSKLCLYPVVSV